MEKSVPPAPLRHAAIDGRSDFTAAVRSVLNQAVQGRARELCFVDPDFSTWPLEDADCLALLAAWARLPKRQLLIVAGQFDALPLRCPRFTAWRRTWSHVVDCRVTDVEASQIPSLLLAGAGSLYLPDRLHSRGHWLADDSEIGAWREVIDVLVQRSEPGFGANTLGL